MMNQQARPLERRGAALNRRVLDNEPHRSAVTLQSLRDRFSRRSCIHNVTEEGCAILYAIRAALFEFPEDEAANFDRDILRQFVIQTDADDRLNRKVCLA